MPRSHFVENKKIDLPTELRNLLVQKKLENKSKIKVSEEIKKYYNQENLETIPDSETLKK